MEFQPPRGTDDLLPPVSDAMLGLYEAAHRTARLYGFRYVETPTFEHTELFARTSGETSDVVTKEMYTFEDKGGRSLTLRPEQTASIVRAYLAHAHDLPTPFKAYHVSQQFRHGRPQAGRLREFRQFGIETIGSAAPERRRRGRRGWVIGSSAGVAFDTVELRLNSIGDGECRPAYREKLIAYLEPHRDELDEDCRTRLRTNPLRVFDCKVDGQTPLVLGAPVISENLCQPCAEHFAAVRNGLDAAPGSRSSTTRGSSGGSTTTRGRRSSSSRARSSQAQGTASRRRTVRRARRGARRSARPPAWGSRSGLDRLLVALRRRASTLPGELGPRVLRRLDRRRGRAGGRRGSSTSLRDAGIPAATAFEERPLKAQLKMADRSGAAYAVILGEKRGGGGDRRSSSASRTGSRKRSRSAMW